MSNIIYYYITVDSNNGISVGSSSGGEIAIINNMPIGVEITEAEYITAMNALKNNKILWIDKNGILQVRDKLTKYDKNSDTWVPDHEAINKENERIKLEQLNNLKSLAKQNLLNTDYLIVPDTFAELTSKNQKQLLNYRKYLRTIMNDTADFINVNENTKLKELGDF